jgi:hypothetical protein
MGWLEIGSQSRSNLRDVVTEADSVREMALKKSKEISTLASRASTGTLCADKKWHNVMVSPVCGLYVEGLCHLRRRKELW